MRHVLVWFYPSGLSPNNLMSCLKFPSISAWPCKAIPWWHRYWIAFICTTRPSRLVSCWLLTCALSCDSMLGLLRVNHFSCASLCVWEDWCAWNFLWLSSNFESHRLWRLSLPFYWTKKHYVCGSIGDISKTLFSWYYRCLARETSWTTKIECSCFEWIVSVM